MDTQAQLSSVTSLCLTTVTVSRTIFLGLKSFLYLPVYRAPVPCLDDQNHKPTILQITNDAIVANAVSPELPQFRALQCLPHLAGVIEIGNAAFEEVS
jgi:hypothetical protein